jgi:hypothetical protein
LKEINRHPKYKSDFCKTFHSKGFCPYGPRCHFIHEITSTTTTTDKKKKIILLDDINKIQNFETVLLNQQNNINHLNLKKNSFISLNDNDNLSSPESSSPRTKSNSCSSQSYCSSSTSNNDLTVNTIGSVGVGVGVFAANNFQFNFDKFSNNSSDQVDVNNSLRPTPLSPQTFQINTFGIDEQLLLQKLTMMHIGSNNNINNTINKSTHPPDNLKYSKRIFRKFCIKTINLAFKKME